MNHSIIDRIAEETGAIPTTKKYLYRDIKHVCFKAGTEYESIAEAAAKLNAETSNDILIWACWHSIEGQPRVAIQWFEYKDPSEVDTSSLSNWTTTTTSNKRAERQSYTTEPNQSGNSSN